MKIVLALVSVVLIAGAAFFFSRGDHGMGQSMLNTDSSLNLSEIESAHADVDPASVEATAFGDWRLECRHVGPKSIKQCLMIQRHAKNVKGDVHNVLSVAVLMVPHAVPVKDAKKAGDAAETDTAAATDAKDPAAQKRKIMAVPVMRLITPMGVYLPGGVVTQIDDNDKKLPVAFQLCAPVGCIAERVLGKEALDDMRGGNKMPVRFQLAGKNNAVPVAVEASLKGFSAAFDSLVKEVATP